MLTYDKNINYWNDVFSEDIYYPEHEQYNRLFLLCNYIV